MHLLFFTVVALAPEQPYGYFDVGEITLEDMGKSTSITSQGT